MKPFDFNKLQATWNTHDEDEYFIPFGEPSNELIEHAEIIAKIFFEHNPWGIGYSALGEILWYDNLWDITDKEELYERIIETLHEYVDNAGIFTKKDVKYLHAFLSSIELKPKK